MNAKELLERRAKVRAQLKALHETGAALDSDGEFSPAWLKADAEEKRLTSQIAECYKGRDCNPDDPVAQARFANGLRSWQSGGRPQADPTAIDLAVSGWIRNQHGVPIPSEEMDAAHCIGLDPRGGAFAIQIPSCRPTVGRNVSFGAVDPLGTQVGVRGGSLIPSGFVANLEVAMKAYSAMFQVAEVMVTDTGNEMSWPTLDDVSNEGVQLGENTAASDDTMTFGAQIFRNHKFSSNVVKASHELIRDSAINLASSLGAALGERLGRIVNRRATVGSGAATLQGIVTGASTGVTAANAGAIAWDELISLQHSVDPAYRVGPGVGWMFHQDIASGLRKIKDGDGRPLWQDTPNAGQPATLLGDPVYLNPNMDSTMTTGKKPILYGNLQKYKLRVVGGEGTGAGGIRFRMLSERYAELDQYGFISLIECDGALLKASSSDSLCPVRVLLMP